MFKLGFIDISLLIIHPVRSRVDSFDRRVSREKRKSLVFSGLF